ncbi:hypothetical protein, partial [Streptomyces griseus]|uniref:hypothetical protein n=1 Tax=Streptomyces griseus TaxID=1911 RepID=UPI00131CDF6E
AVTRDHCPDGGAPALAVPRVEEPLRKAKKIVVPVPGVFTHADTVITAPAGWVAMRYCGPLNVPPVLVVWTQAVPYWASVVSRTGVPLYAEMLLRSTSALGLSTRLRAMTGPKVYT